MEIHVIDDNIEMLREISIAWYELGMIENPHQELYVKGSIVQQTLLRFLLFYCKTYEAENLTPHLRTKLGQLILILESGKIQTIMTGGKKKRKTRVKKGKRKSRRKALLKSKRQHGGGRFDDIISIIGFSIIFMLTFNALSVSATQLMTMAQGIETMRRLHLLTKMGIFTNIDGICTHIVLSILGCMSGLGGLTFKDALNTLHLGRVYKNTSTAAVISKMSDQELADKLLPLYKGLFPKLREEQEYLLKKEFQLKRPFQYRLNRQIIAPGKPAPFEHLDYVKILGQDDDTNIFVFHDQLIKTITQGHTETTPGNVFAISEVFWVKGTEGHTFFVLYYDSVQFGKRISLMDTQLAGHWRNGTFLSKESDSSYIYPLPLPTDNPETAYQDLVSLGFPREAISKTPFIASTAPEIFKPVLNNALLRVTVMGKGHFPHMPDASSLTSEESELIQNFLTKLSEDSIAKHSGRPMSPERISTVLNSVIIEEGKLGNQFVEDLTLPVIPYTGDETAFFKRISDKKERDQEEREETKRRIDEERRAQRRAQKRRIETSNKSDRLQTIDDDENAASLRLIIIIAFMAIAIAGYKNYGVIQKFITSY